MKNKTWLILCAALIIWRIFVLALTLNASNFFPQIDTFLYSRAMETSSLPMAVFSHANFDGFHYLRIAEHGYYGTGLIQAFFPLYPLLVRALSVLPMWAGEIHAYFLSALTISTLATVGFAGLWFCYVKKLFKTSTAWWALVAVLLFPVSFYLVNVYNESLFLLLLVLALILYRQQKWLPMSLVLMLLTATRIVGIVAVIAFAIAYIVAKIQDRKLSSLPLLYIFGGSLGLVLYMVFLYLNFGDPVYFWTVQSEFGASRQTNLVFLPQVIFRYLRMMVDFWRDGILFSWHAYPFVQEFVLSIITLLILIWQTLTLKLLQPLWQKLKIKFLEVRANSTLPLEILLFSGGAFLVPTLTGNFSSMPRYILSSLSIFIWVACLKSKVAKVIILLVSLIFLIINTILFSAGYWVA